MMYRRRAPHALVAAAFATGPGLLGCGHGASKPAPGPASTASATAPSASAPQAAAPASPPADAGAYEGPWLGAIVMQAPIWSEMEVPNDKGDRRSERENKSYRLGYLRYGERAAVIPDPHPKPNCPEGWYELLSGGFVCGKYVTLDLDHPKFKMAHVPDLDGSLPYTYGINLVNGTPLYRTLPSRAQRKRFEPWLFRPRKAKVAEDDDSTAASAVLPLGPTDAGASGAGTAGSSGLGSVSAGAAAAGAFGAAGTMVTTSGSNGSAAMADDADADTPWWERESPDGGPPQITLEDLQESGGPIARRMVKGFYLSLDREMDGGGAKWWKTIAGLSAPADRILVTKPITEFHGVWLGKDDATFPTKNVPAHRVEKLPVAFVMGYYAKRWTFDDERKHPSIAEGALDHFDAFGLTGEKVRANGYEFWETDQGFWLRSNDITRTEPGPAPEKLGEHEKWIDVNLKRQTLVAFEGQTAVYATLVSSGRNEHETPPGSFRIHEKHISATMDGDAELAADGPYSIEDVPYIEYFNAGYALHGAFWHGAFGNVKSHGCVNLAPWDAKAIFGWTDPQLPEGWHAVYATKDKPGTRVIVHEKGPGTCEGPNAAPPQCPDAR